MTPRELLIKFLNIPESMGARRSCMKITDYMQSDANNWATKQDGTLMQATWCYNMLYGGEPRYTYGYVYAYCRTADKLLAIIEYSQDDLHRMQKNYSISRNFYQAEALGYVAPRGASTACTYKVAYLITRNGGTQRLDATGLSIGVIAIDSMKDIVADIPRNLREDYNITDFSLTDPIYSNQSLCLYAGLSEYTASSITERFVQTTENPQEFEAHARHYGNYTEGYDVKQGGIAENTKVWWSYYKELNAPVLISTKYRPQVRGQKDYVFCRTAAAPDDLTLDGLVRGNTNHGMTCSHWINARAPWRWVSVNSTKLTGLNVLSSLCEHTHGMTGQCRYLAQSFYGQEYRGMLCEVCGGWMYMPGITRQLPLLPAGDAFFTSTNTNTRAKDKHHRLVTVNLGDTVGFLPFRQSCRGKQMPATEAELRALTLYTSDSDLLDYNAYLCQGLSNVLSTTR